MNNKLHELPPPWIKDASEFTLNQISTLGLLSSSILMASHIKMWLTSINNPPPEEALISLDWAEDEYHTIQVTTADDAVSLRTSWIVAVDFTRVNQGFPQSVVAYSHHFQENSFVEQIPTSGEQLSFSPDPVFKALYVTVEVDGQTYLLFENAFTHQIVAYNPHSEETHIIVDFQRDTVGVNANRNHVFGFVSEPQKITENSYQVFVQNIESEERIYSTPVTNVIPLKVEHIFQDYYLVKWRNDDSEGDHQFSIFDAANETDNSFHMLPKSIDGYSVDDVAIGSEHVAISLHNHQKINTSKILLLSREDFIDSNFEAGEFLLFRDEIGSILLSNNDQMLAVLPPESNQVLTSGLHTPRTGNLTLVNLETLEVSHEHHTNQEDYFWAELGYDSNAGIPTPKLFFMALIVFYLSYMYKKHRSKA